MMSGIHTRAAAGALFMFMLTAGAPAGQDWTRWGGPNGDFSVTGVTLARSWPADGPRKLWSRELGAGHSAILCEDGVLYTMLRRGEQDVVIAIKASDGATVWESAYDAPPKQDMLLDFGPGPHATPLIVGDRVFTVGGTVILNAWDKKTGKNLWRHDLIEEMGASHLGRGYGPSPVAYKDTVLINVGARDVGVVAFKQDDGAVVWKGESFRGGQATPLLARINNEDHLVLATGVNRVGLDPADGKVRWKHQVDQQQAALMSTPLFIQPDTLFFSAAYGGGSLALKITPKDGAYEATELWHTRRMLVQHESMVQVGSLVCGSSGDFGPAFLTALDLKDGKAPWRERGFAKSNLLKVDDLLLILDETGDLALASASPEGLTIHARAKLLEEKAWTVPTLVGSTLFLRDNKSIMALDLSPGANG